MPGRPKKEGVEPKRRSRTGCWPCKKRKIKCDERKPGCTNCQKQSEVCDYSIRLNWDGRGKNLEPASSGPDVAGLPRDSASATSPHQIVDSTDSPYALSTQWLKSQRAAVVQPTLYTSNILQAGELEPSRERAFRPISDPTETRFTTIGVRNESSMQSSSVANQTWQSEVVANPIAIRPSKRRRINSTGKDYVAPVSSHMLPTGYNASSTSSMPKTPRSAIKPAFNACPTHDTPALRVISTSLPPSSPHDPVEGSFRRFSVESLLSGPAGMGTSNAIIASTSSFGLHESKHQEGANAPTPDSQNSTCFTRQEFVTENVHDFLAYGLDRGFSDLDIPANLDMVSTSVDSSIIQRVLPVASKIVRIDDTFAFDVVATHKDDLGEDYYAKPAEIRLHRSFFPLPEALRGNPMNVLYFHYFISHTARILVPHHCSSNPFQHVLPRMALQDESLMSLLLAYSAAHRARHLKHPEPTRRIASWLQDVIPNLRNSLADHSRRIDNSTLATSIMLASLEIISPKSLGDGIGWQTHLDIARQLITIRGGTNSMHQEHSEVTHFLLRWFAYLDVIGGLVGGEYSGNGNSWASQYDLYDDEHDSLQIDCLLGFTTRCISILARTSDLARIVTSERRSSCAARPDVSFQLLTQHKEKAHRLITDIKDSLEHTAIRKCPHVHYSGVAVAAWDDIEMRAVNEAYHRAGLVHVLRRVLGYSQTDPRVQVAVTDIVEVLQRVRQGSTAEACLLFPMFTAGCEVVERAQRMEIGARMRRVEGTGMSQVAKARRLMEMVWQTGKPWETLVSGEFVG